MVFVFDSLLPVKKPFNVQVDQLGYGKHGCLRGRTDDL